MNSESTNTPLVYSFKEVADELCCSVQAVRRLVKIGELKGLSLSGGKIKTRVVATSLRKFVERASR